MNRYTASMAAAFVVMTSAYAFASQKAAMTYPQEGLVCDSYICADSSGISEKLTGQFLGEQAAQKLKSQGDFDMTEFTFENGVFCDTKEKQCHTDRYFDANGKRSAVDDQNTKALFGS